jgi:hypothetical protein
MYIVAMILIWETLRTGILWTREHSESEKMTGNGLPNNLADQIGPAFPERPTK